MTTDPNPASARDMTADVDLERLVRELPVVKDLKDFEIPGFFDSDDELEDFLTSADHDVDAP